MGSDVFGFYVVNPYVETIEMIHPLGYPGHAGIGAFLPGDDIGKRWPGIWGEHLEVVSIQQRGEVGGQNCMAVKQATSG